MATPDQNIHRLYQNGLKHFSLPDFDTFQRDMKDEAKRRRFYSNMQSAYSLPDFDTFSTDIGAVETTTTKVPDTTTTTVTTPPATPTRSVPAAPSTQAQPTGTTSTPSKQPAGLNLGKAVAALVKPSGGGTGAEAPSQNQSAGSSAPGGSGYAQESNGSATATPQVGGASDEYVPMWRQKESEYRKAVNNMAQILNDADPRKQKSAPDVSPTLFITGATTDKMAGASEKAWSDAEQRQKKDRDRNAEENWGYYNSMGGGREMRVVTSSQNRYDDQVSHYTNFDLGRLMDDAWNNLGDKGQQDLINECYQTLRAKNPEASEEDLKNYAKELARQQSNQRLYNLAVQKNLPKDNLEYLARLVGDANLLLSIPKAIAVSEAKSTGDMAAYEEANEQYRQDGHKVISVVGNVAGFAFDPTTWVSGGVGSAAAGKAIWTIGARKAATEAAKKTAARSFATSMTGRIVGGVAGGAANFGTYEGLKEVENQFVHGGHVVGRDESGLYITDGYSVGAVAGQAGHGLLMGGAVGWLAPVSGNVSDKLVRGGELFGKTVSGVRSTIGKVGTRAGIYTGATLAEGTIFSIPEWISGDRDALDVWTDNMAMMVGFKAKHIVKSAGGVLSDLKASLESPTDGSKNRMDFMTRLRQRMDAPSDGGLALSRDGKLTESLELSKDEKAELERYGYGNLQDLVKSAESTGVAEKGELIAENATEIVSRLTDMVKDSRISEAARAKMYYYATGRRLPMSTIMRGELIEDGKGGFIVESQGANGVITSRSFKNRKAAELELERIKYQAELNSIEYGERYQQIVDFETRLRDACHNVAAQFGWNEAEVYRMCNEARQNKLYTGDKQFDEVRRNIIVAVSDAMGDFKETDVTDAIREGLNEKYGVDIDKVIRKNNSRRKAKEQEAIDEYIQRLFPEKEESARPVEDVEAEDIANQRRLPYGEDSQNTLRSDDSANTYDSSSPTLGGAPEGGEKRPVGRAVMKYKDREVEVLRGRVVMTDDGAMVDKRRSDRTIIVRDVATGKVEMVAPEHILTYEEYGPEGRGEAPEQDDAASLASVDSRTGGEQDGTAADGVASAAQPEYGERSIKMRSADGKEEWAYLTGEVDEEGRYEYYVPASPDRLYYATREELDAMVTEFGPRVDMPAPETESRSGAPERDGSARVESADMRTGGLNGSAPTEAAAPAEGASAPVSDEEVVIHGGIEGSANGLRDAFRAERERIGNEWLANTAVHDALSAYARGAGSVEELIERAKADSSDDRTRQRLDTLLEFDSTRKQLEQMLADQNGSASVEGEGVDRRTEGRDGQVSSAGLAPLQRIPRDAKGKPVFDAEGVDSDTAWDALVEYMEGEDDAMEFARGRVEDLTADVAKAEKELTKKVKSADPDAFKQEKAERRARLADAQRRLAHWQEVSARREARMTDAERAARDAELQRREEEEMARMRAEREERERTQAAERERRAEERASRPGEYAAVMAKWDEPASAEEYILRALLRGVKLRWSDKGMSHKTRGVGAHLFGGDTAHSRNMRTNKEYAVRRWFVDDNNGMSPEKFAELVCSEFYHDYENGTDHSQEALTAILDILRNNPTSRGMWSALRALHGETAHHAEGEREIDPETQAWLDAQGLTIEEADAMQEEIDHFVDRYGMTPEEYEDMYIVHGHEMDMTDEEHKVLTDYLSSATADEEYERRRLNDEWTEASNEMLSRLTSEERAAIDSVFVEQREQEQEAQTKYDRYDRKETAEAGTPASDTRGTVGDGETRTDVVPVRGLHNASDSARPEQGDVPSRPADVQDTSGSRDGADGEVTADNKRGERGGAPGVAGRQHGDLTRNKEVNTNLSDDTNEYGKPFVLAKDGSTTFGTIDAESGLTEAPIRLSLGENSVDGNGRNHGYGLLHIEAGHGNEIRNAGYASVEEFVEEVAKNYTDIREGAKIGENQTYLLEVSDEHNNTLFIQLSNDGTYWNVNSAGIFKKKYSRRKPKVYSVPAVGDGKDTDTTEVISGKSKGATAPAGNSSETSKRKVSNFASDKQASDSESSEQSTESKESKDGAATHSVQAAVEAASAQVNTEPTPAQAEAGNYKKGHVTIGEFDITIENPAGSLRKGVDADGKEWSTTMANTYGYIKGTEGVDGDHIDVFLHSDMDQWNGRKVFVVDQTNTDGTFDEHKVMLGFNSREEAMEAYLANYDKTWGETHPGLRISETTVGDFGKWVESSHRKMKPFADYKSQRTTCPVCGKKHIPDFKSQNVTCPQCGTDLSVFRQIEQLSDEEAADTLRAIERMKKEAATIEGEGYKIEPKPYTNKQGKTLDTYLITFDRDFSKEELSALRAKAKALKGWYDRESKGWMLRSSEDAKAFAEEVTAKSEDEVADEAPLSMADMEKPAAKPKKAEAPAKPTESPMKQVDVEGVFDALKTNGDGETKLSDHATPVQYKDPLTEDVIATLAKWDMAPTHKLAESRLARHYSISYTRAGRILREIQELSKPTTDNTPKTTGAPAQEAPKPKKRRWISDEDADEFDSLRKDLRSHIGKDGDIVQEAGADYGKPKPKQMDAEVLRMGTRMTYLMMKGGLRSFSDYCEAMKDELPDIFDDMRPHLKSLYAAAQNMEEVIELGWDEEMDDRKTIKAFDVYNFDKPGAKDIIATAQHAVDENASQQQTDQIIQTLKDQRNEQRKKEADKTSADTETIIDKAETTASQVESKLEAANSEEDAEGLSRSLDKELEEVNKQLALLGYYEADPVDKDFNEAYGYMRNAERKAVQDAHRLATQLASDLGISIDPKDKVRKAKYGFGSKIARSNVAPAGGEVYITLPLAEGRELSIWLSLDKNEPWRDGGREDRTNEDLMLTGIMYRIENTGKGGMDRYESSNHNTRPTIPYDELLSDIRRLVRTYLPDETVKPATPLAPQPGEDMVDMAKRVAADKEPKAPAVEPQQTIASLFGDELENFDNQGNPIDGKGKYVVEEVKSVSDISDDDFMNPTRNVALPELPERVSDAIGAEGRRPMIKKNIFGKNRNSHKDLTAEDGRRILNEVLYNPNLYGQNQKVSRPYNWIMVHLSEKNSAVVLEVNPTKDYLEIVNWHYLKGRQLEQKKRQAEREGGRILTLQESSAAGDASQGLSSADKGNDKSLNNKTNEKTDIQPRAEGTGRGGQQPRPNEPLGEGARHEDERTDGGRMAQGGGEHSVSDSGRGTGVSGLHQSERGVSARRTPNIPKNTRNNHAERGTDYAPKGEKARIDVNIAALELAKKLLASGATATPQEMAILRRYSGWGGLGAAFNEGSAWAPNPVNKRLREALTPEEYQAAVMSRNSAYYTPAAVIDAMWDVAKALGFKGGNIVEGSAGIGNIIGLMPTDISERSNIHAVEIDPTTGGILSLLYPDAKVEVQGFEQTRIANGSVDLAITNVPFVTDLHVMDESGDSDLSKKFRDIHDFCIAKNVRKLREGGIGIFITSSGTLDKSQKLRNWLVGDKDGNADVVGVFRMNNQTFGGTAATSDIIVVRKRVNGRKSANAIDVSTVTPARTVTFTDARGKTKDLPLYVNRYFIEHPEHMGGEMFFGFEQGDTYRPASIGLFPTRTADQAARMAAWVQHLADMDWRTEAVSHIPEQTSHINEALGEGVKEGSMVTDSEGNLCVARMGRAVPLTLNKNKIKGRTKEECFKDYTEIKTALADVLKYQTEHDDDAGLQPLLDRLNRTYDTFVQRYGNLNKNNNLAWLRNDVDFSSIVALETYSEKGNKDGTKVKTYGKTDIFSRRVVEKESEPTPKNVKDGIIASIYKYGRIDTEYLATQLDKPQEDVKQEIVESGLGFVDPTTGQMEVSYEYLSGNVREKLRQAREANEAAGGAYDANVKALEAVVPMNIPAHLIEFALGSSWIEPQLYERYVKERTELDVKLTNAGGTWHMSEPWNTDKPKNTEMGVRSEAFGILIHGHKLIEAALTNKTITVSRTVKDSDGGSHTETDPAATTACATKVDEIRQDFKDWAREQMQNDPALSMRMEEKYNEKFNNSVPKTIPDEFVPEHFGGAATTVGGRPFKLRPHQAKAVIRATTQPVLLAHEVGTGKTYTLITTAMEMRRLGTARKPMIVVQNATVGQFVASAKALYPNAKVLTLEDADRNAEGRRAFYAKIKFNDWDMIVVPQSVFERIPDSIERQTQFIQDKIEEKMLVLEQMKEADPDGRSMIVRAAEREISRLEDEMSQLASGEEPTSGKKKKDAKKAAITRQNAEVKARELLDRATDDVEDFDSMGIDAILVDEAHEYKHLGFATAMQRGVKGVDPSPSKKSQGVFLKTQAVLEKTGGKNVVFATGTPISNTAAEIWTFMRYLIPADVMKEYDIYYFDDFVRNFGNLQQMLEFKTNGKYDEVNRFAGYVNLPELVRIWSTVADTVLTREAGGVSDKIPQMEGGKAQDIFLPQTRALRSIMKFVKDELKRYEDMTGKEKKENSHIPLVMYGIAKAAAVDARLVQSDAKDDPNSKTNEAVRQTLRTLDETKDYKGTVAIFADNYQNKHSGFNLYEDIRKKLIAAGVPEEQVVVMKSGMTVKKKLEIFDRVNAGEVRVVMGSTFTLGTGVNIQERLHTLIHLDAPNRPMDYTQRNGRILRQGNLHNTWGLPVRVLRFGVEDSLDVTAYQRLKTKGAIADSIMNGKQLMANSMENRTLEEDQDLFGDITAQLSGSEYAMLKNQIEKEVRKLKAAEKNWKADQTYIHNRKRQIAGQNRETEKRIADDKSYLEKVEATTIGDITVGKLSFPSVDAMEDFFTEQNKKKAAMQEEVRTSGYASRPATSDITISVGGFDFNIHTEITKEMKHQQGDLFATAPAKMTYSCSELGIDAIPVRGNAIKNAVLDIMENVVSGKDFRERISNAENYLERNNAEFDAISKRDGQPFKDAEALEKAEEKLAEYEELMKAEMAAKEAKYAEMDKDVEAAAGIELTEEDSEPTASEPIADYSAENGNFASRYETQDGKTINYASESVESYGGLFDYDFSGKNRGSDAVGSRAEFDILQRERSATLAATHGGRLNRKTGEYCNVERVFTESGSFKFTSGEKIKNADDVAFIFSALEDAAVEHTFAVYVKDGVPTVVELGMGSFNASIANSGPAYLAYTRIKPDEVYFVHNHPSGNLKCSAPDVRLLKQFQEMFDVPVYGVIINLKTGKYGTFDIDNNMGVGNKRIPEKEYPLTLHKLDKQIFAPDYDPMAQPMIRGSHDVASFVNSHRMGDRAKMSFLVISQSGGIVGNIHMPYKQVSPANVEKMAQYISERVIQFGGMSAIVYGDFSGENNHKSLKVLRERMKQLGGVNLLDVMRIEGKFTFSANDEGILYEPGSEYGASPEGDIRYREVEDDAVLKEFAEGKTVKAYRTMQVIDGKLYSPMATKVGGKATPEIKLGVPEQAEEHPEIIKRTKVGRDGIEVGYVVIDKGLGKGSLEVAYNPSIHASLTPLNDQFTSADIRPNLVIVETLIPKSELTSGYRAPMAKDAVGEMSWHSGTVSGKLAELGKPRRVILSRYDMPVRIVPFKEVAQMIAAQLDGTDIAIPYNVVTPQVRMELSRLGIAISDTPSGSVGDNRDFGKAEYITDQEIERLNARQQEMAQTSEESKRNYAEKLAKKFNTPIEIVDDVEKLLAEMRKAKGGYDVRSGKVVVVLPNNANVEDVAETVFHEVVAHKGLREMVGEERYDAFCDEVYDHLKDELKEEVDRETTRRFEREPEKGYEHARRVAVDEMFGRMAEKGFEEFTRAERGIWAKLKTKVLEAINRFLGSLKLPRWVRLGDNELRYMLWRSHERLRSKGDYVDMARDAAKRDELGLNGNDFTARNSEWDKKNVVGDNEARLNDLHPADADHAAKVAKTLDDAKSSLSEIAKAYKSSTEPRGFITSLKEGLRLIGGTSSSGYRSFELKDGRIFTLRVSNHNINSENAKNEPVVSIVIKSRARRNTFIPSEGKSVDEYVYMKEEIRKAEAGALSKIAESIAELLETGKYRDRTGLARENHSRAQASEFRHRDGETGDIWKDQNVGLQERITNAAIRLSNNQSGDLTLRNDAQKAVVNNLQSLLHSMRNRRGTAQSFIGADRKVEAGVVGAMNAQAMFDRATVKRVSDLARILMQNGYLSGMTSGEMQRLLSVVKNATAMHDIADSVQKIMDIMVNNQLRNAEGAMRKLLSIRGSKVDARGVEVQGELDVEGQRTMEVVKKAMPLSEDDISDRIAEALNRMGDPDQTIADNAAIEYAGLNMALEYVQNIAGSKAEEKALRDSLKTANEDRDAGRMADDAYKQFVEATEDAIRKNKVERAEAYYNLVGRLSDSLRESIENAKAFREAEKARVREIHHNANSDMEGRPTNEHHKDNWKDKFVNNGFVQFLFAPLGTFDQILRVFGNKSANGEGYLWNRFMRGWVDCRNKELTGVKEKFARLDEKAAELFGKGKTWGNLIRMEAKMPKATVSFMDGGEMRDHELTQGNLLYIYMVDKMTDGRMKLRRMGITEDDITRIENFLDPHFKALGDWLQDEFLVDTRNEYNETHKRMFGASMAAIENYFPLKILANARVDKEEDVNQQNRPDGITTKTGSIIKRRVNNLALDITGADALSVILDHITQMEHWSAYAEWNRDLNTLRTYKRFRNQVINMTTVYGGGRKLWENFNDLCLMAAGEYRPPVSKLNKSAVNLAKGVTAAKVSFRMYTALKQFLSAPAYAPEVSMRSILKSIANPYGDFKWCLENMPIFRERWHSRISGDPRLLKSDMDWKMWRSRIMEISSRIGMTPNAFVDAVTVSIGARAMYETRLKQYLKEGYPADAAEKRAMQDATILFNQTQQSSESPFLSTMQVDKDWLSTLFTVFRNSAMSYTRQEFDAMRNLKRNLTPGQQAKSIEFMTKQILRDWDVDPDTATDAERDQAQGAAKKRFRRQIKKDVLRLATFGFILELAWNLGPYLPYMFFGNDEDEKDKMWDDAFTHAYFGSVEGLTGGDVMSSFGNMWASGEWNWNQLSKDMPLASDINTIGSKFVGGKNAEAINDIINVIVQMGVGMNPQSLTDTAIAITDACGDDPALSHEAAIFAMRVLQVPQSQIDKMYFDEVDLTGEEASKLTPAQLAQRYAEYKVKRGTPLAPWSWDDEERLGKYKERAEERMQERREATEDADVLEAYAVYEERSKAVGLRIKEAKEMVREDYVAGATAFAALSEDPDMGIYNEFKTLDRPLRKLSKMWLKAETPEDAALTARTIAAYRAGMVKVLGSETAESQQSAMSELTTLMNDFYAKYQGMQPKQVNR